MQYEEQLTISVSGFTNMFYYALLIISKSFVDRNENMSKNNAKYR